MNEEIKIKLNPRIWLWLMLYGITLILGGILSLILPTVAGTAVEFLVGAVLLVTGVLSVISGIVSGDKNRWLLIGTGLLEIIFAVLILTHPIAGLIALTAYVGIGFIFQAFGRILLIRRFGGINHHFFWFLSALSGLIVGGIILADLTSSATWVLGAICGISFLLSGFGTCLAALGLKSQREDVSNHEI